jgi:hypothetical protein
MKSFKEYIIENSSQKEKDNFHYDSSKFDSNGVFSGMGHKFFAVGATVKTPEIYKGVGHGVVKNVYKKNGSGGVNYEIEHNLPKGHEDAYDENGEPDHKKTAIHSDDALQRHN